jgi:hypothetical protein
MKICEWMKSVDPEWNEDSEFFNPADLEGPSEIVINEDGSWEASYEGRLDSDFVAGKGLEDLKAQYKEA